MKVIVSGLILLALTGCGHILTKRPQVVDQETGAEVTPVGSDVPAATNDLSDDESDIVQVPHEFNQDVQKWVNYFTGRGRHHMDRYLARSSRYLPMMKKILRENGLPSDLVYIALIESGFNSKAHSHANAVGYWQFIRGTGKRYGLEINGLIDERRDFILSTEAAAQYYKALYNLFGSWYLAIAAYNTGENRVKRAVMRHYSRDFWVLAKKRALPRETVNYVPKYLAARMIAKHPEQYGFTNIEYQPPVEFDVVELNQTVDLKKWAQAMDADPEVVLALNPAYKFGVVPAKSGGVKLRVPKGLTDNAIAAATVAEISESEIARVAHGEYYWYRIRRGDNLSTIAARHGTSVRKIQDLNNMGRRTFLRVGQRLKVPERGGSRYIDRPARTESVAASSPSTEAVADNGEVIRYRIRRGDTLISIAKRYNTTVSALQSLNNLRRRSTLYAGQTLLIPASGSGGRSPGSSYFKYKVERGDTLYGLASRYGVSVNDLAALNGLSRKSMLFYGQLMKIPSKSGRPSYHVVRPGETLIHISRSYNVSLSELTRLNKISNKSLIHVGRRLIIPQ